MSKRFNIKRKPEKPERQSTRLVINDVGESLENLTVEEGIDYLISIQRDHKQDLRFEIERHEGCLDDELRLVALVPESDKTYNQRLLEYEQSLEEYEVWMELNKIAVVKELRRRESEKKIQHEQKVLEMEEKLRKLKEKNT